MYLIPLRRSVAIKFHRKGTILILGESRFCTIKVYKLKKKKNPLDDNAQSRAKDGNSKQSFEL